MTITRIGTNQKYSSGWDAAFNGSKKKATKSPTSTSSKTVATKKGAKKSAKAVTSKAASPKSSAPTAKKAVTSVKKKAAKKAAKNLQSKSILSFRTELPNVKTVGWVVADFSNGF